VTRVVRTRGHVERAGTSLGTVAAKLVIIDAQGGERSAWRGTLTGAFNWDALTYGEELTLRIEGGGAGRFLVEQRVMGDDGVYIIGTGYPPV
jgi:hypothetical protein